MGGRVTREVCGGGAASGRVAPRATPGASGRGAPPRVSGPAVPMRARELLGRADSLLAEASCAAAGRSPGRGASSGDAAEAFRLAYVAAVRGAAAVLAAGGGAVGPGAGVRRPRSRSAWVMLSACSPEFAEWADYFAAHSSTRAAIEAGITGKVGADRAEALLAETRRFLDEVEAHLVGAARFDQARW
ncbi:SAV_6107 family HEPN domain-containing protein [Speluncibacter jeojiensis]|uniref:SAV_6107 family HEPN domain-containing protein n=1 Tax=Speluncibacter jeojiensis TaxID=2710754 RepID=A0A9X4LW62_9ACTN|nr:SAV_6107 family HEPN domain-containing protein [Corynebacteriales bacterium D3-21]